MPTAVTALPGTRGCARGARWSLEAGCLDPRTTTKHVDPDIKNYFQDSSIGARRAGGEARFDDLLLRAARGIVMPFRNALRNACSRTALKQVRGTDSRLIRAGARRPAPPGPTLIIIIYTFIIWPAAPRGHGPAARTPHAPRSSGPQDCRQVVISRHRAVLRLTLLKALSVTLMSTTITLHETFLQHEHPHHEPNCEHGLRLRSAGVQHSLGPGVCVCVHCSLLPTCTGQYDSRSRSAES